MKLGTTYTNNAYIVKSDSAIADSSKFGYIVSDTFDNLFSAGSTFDTTVLLNNGTPWKQLNTGSLGTKYPAYNLNNAVKYGVDFADITYLGSALVWNWSSYSGYVNLSKRVGSNISGTYSDFFNKIKNARFILDYVDSVTGVTTTPTPVSYTGRTDKKGFSAIYFTMLSSYHDRDNPVTSQYYNGYTSEPSRLTGDNAKRIFDSYTSMVNFTNYSPTLTDGTSLKIESPASSRLVYFYLINGDVYCTGGSPTGTLLAESGINITLDSTTNFLSVGSFSKTYIPESTSGGKLPENDNEYGIKVWSGYFSTQTWQNKTVYYYTSNRSIYMLNCTGVRWSSTAITTAKTFRDNINLPAMDKNGQIIHNLWYHGETAINNSNSYNKSGKYDDIPERRTVWDDNDKITDMEIGVSPVTVAGFVNYYRVNKGQLDNISNALTQQTQYTDLMQNIVSVKSYLINPENFIATTTTESVKIGAFDTSVGADKITGANNFLNVGSYTVTGKFGNSVSPHFLDKSPYTKIELYVPWCGTIELPDFCMYKTIDVFMLTDIVVGSCMAVVKCNGNIVAQKSGLLAQDLPLSSIDNATKYNACLSGVLNTATSLSTSVMAGATGNPVGVFNGVMSSMANANNLRMSQNANYTRVVGVHGDSTQNNMPSQCYIKIYRPIINEPAGYTHRYGKPCNKYGELSTFTGFTQCVNPDITGNMTEKEKELIKTHLERGVYL